MCISNIKEINLVASSLWFCVALLIIGGALFVHMQLLPLQELILIKFFNYIEYAKLFKMFLYYIKAKNEKYN